MSEQEDQNAIQAFLKNKKVTKCPEGDGMRYVKLAERGKRAVAEFVGGGTYQRSGNNKSKNKALSANTSTAEKRLLDKIEEKQLG